MLPLLARTAVVHRRAALLVTALCFLMAAALGGNVEKHLTVGGFTDPQSEAAHASDVLLTRFHTGDPDFFLVVHASHGTVDAARIARRGVALAKQVAAIPGVIETTSYWTLAKAPPLRSRDGRSALVVAVVKGDDSAVSRAVALATQRFQHRDDGVSAVGVGGIGAILHSAETQTKRDLTKAELIAAPITFLLLLFAFRSVIAALLPLAAGGVSIVATFFLLRATTEFTTVSIFALNIATALGFGLAVDYSLFMVTRFREERASGLSPNDAAAITVRTTGRTVLFSALVLSISLSALLIFPMNFLRSVAYGGVAITVCAAVVALVPLPAALAMLGDRVDMLTVRRRASSTGANAGVWSRLAAGVMRSPARTTVEVSVVLVLLAVPFFGVHFGFVDESVLPRQATVRQVMTEVRREFSTSEGTAFSVVMPGVDMARHAGEVDRYARRLSLVRGIGRVDAPNTSYTRGTGIPLERIAPALHANLERRLTDRAGTWLRVVPAHEPTSAAADVMVDAIRAVPTPLPRLVGGFHAAFSDTTRELRARLPIAIALIAAVTFLLLFLMFGSVIVPFKALLLNVLSLTATFGAMVWIFQEGHLSGLLDFTATGTLFPPVPLLAFCVAFGLSMDYEVFLLSRIKEEYDRTGDNAAAIVSGIEKTGPLITAAALIVSAVFFAFATSGISIIKLLGLTLALAVLVDAFVIRATLVPALMRLAGRANWWAPMSLKRLHERMPLSESRPDNEAPPAAIDLAEETGDFFHPQPSGAPNTSRP